MSCIGYCLKTVDTYLEKNIKECFKYKNIDKILVNVIIKNFFLFHNTPYFDFSKGEISHFNYNLDVNFVKNLNYNRKLKMHNWNFLRKSYKFFNNFKSNNFRTALPGYDNYNYVMKLSLTFYFDIDDTFIRMKLLKLTKNHHKGFKWSKNKGFKWSKNAHPGYDSCMFILATTHAKLKIVFELPVYIAYLKFLPQKIDFLFHMQFLYTASCQLLNCLSFITYIFSFMMSMESTMCMKPIIFSSHEEQKI